MYAKLEAIKIQKKDKKTIPRKEWTDDWGIIIENLRGSN